MGEIWARYRGDRVTHILPEGVQARYGRGMGEIGARYRGDRVTHILPEGVQALTDPLQPYP